MPRAASPASQLYIPFRTVDWQAELFRISNNNKEEDQGNLEPLSPHPGTGFKDSKRFEDKRLEP